MADETRVRKVQDRIQQTVARLLGRRIKDPRLSMVTITDVRVTGDLQHASVFFTVMGGDEEREAAAKAFKSATGMIRSEVGKALGIRLTPSLEFIPDALPENAAHLEDALEAARRHDEEVAKLREGATYAGDEDPYRRDDEEDDLDDDDDLDDAPDDLSDDQVDEELLESDREDFNPDDDDDEDAEAELDLEEDAGDDSDVADFEVLDADDVDKF